MQRILRLSAVATSPELKLSWQSFICIWLGLVKVEDFRNSRQIFCNQLPYVKKIPCPNTNCFMDTMNSYLERQLGRRGETERPAASLRFFQAPLLILNSSCLPVSTYKDFTVMEAASSAGLGSRVLHPPLILMPKSQFQQQVGVCLMCKYMKKSLGKKVTLDFQNVLSICIPQLVLLLLHFITSGLCTGNRVHVVSVLCSLSWSNNKCCWSKDSYFVSLPKRECKWKTGGKKSSVLLANIPFLFQYWDSSFLLKVTLSSRNA